jgi:predicted alpha/beta hydrolase
LKTITPIKIICEDYFELSGTRYQPQQAKAAIMIAPATGIKRQFYNSFAQFLLENNFGVITFDNRGISESIGKSINSSNASLTNWGKLDMPAVLETLKTSFPNVDYHLIGHSAGGQLVGLMNNARDLKSLFNFGSSSGSLHYAKYPFKLKSAFWMNCYIPMSNFIFGHTKSQWVGMGEPLPKNVASEWRRWCNGKGYVAVDLDTKIKTHLYKDLALPSLWLHAEDDDIANEDTVKDMVRVYSKIQYQVITLKPRDFDFKNIGHMSFFRTKKKVLWHFALDWLNKNH